MPIKTTKPTKVTPAESTPGTIVIDGVSYEVRGHATIPTIKIETDVPRIFQLTGKIQTLAKRDKDGPVIDTRTGEAAIIETVNVIDVKTGEIGKIVLGVILSRALKEYPAGYEGRTFMLVKKDAPTNKAKPWIVSEVVAK